MKFDSTLQLAKAISATDEREADFCDAWTYELARELVRQTDNVSLVAKRLEASATESMRAALCAMRDGDTHGAARRHVIAAREYQWAAQLWMEIGNHHAKMACFARADSVHAGMWKDIESGLAHDRPDGDR